MSNAESRNLKLGIAGSLAIHGLALLTFACWVAFAPAPEKPPHKDEPPEAVVLAQDIEVLPAPPPEPTPQPPKPKPVPRRRLMDTADNTPATEAPKNADFVSDRNTTASAKKAPTTDGDPSLPSTQGVKVSTLDMTNREYRPGEIKDERAPATPPSPPPVPAAPPKPQAPPPTPEQKPPPQEMAKKDDSPPEKMMKELDEALQKDAKEKKDLEIRKAEEPRPKPPAMKLPEEPAVPTQSAPPLPPPTPATPTLPDTNEFVPQKRSSEQKGRVSKLGAQDSVDAEDTPEGRYRTAVRAAVSQRWHYHQAFDANFKQPSDILVQFTIGKDGKPSNLRLVSSNANAAWTDITLGCVKEAKIPPIPAELRRQMTSDLFDMPMEFVLY